MPYIPPSVVREVKRMDLLTYLKNYEPYELVHFSGNTYTTRTHDSLKISNGKWMWWSQRTGGRSALDYLIKVRGYSFLEAVELLAERANIQPPLCVTCRTLSFVWSYGDSGWSPGSNEPSIFHSVMWGQCKNCPYFFAVLRHGNRDLYFYQEILPTR